MIWATKNTEDFHADRTLRVRAGYFFYATTWCNRLIQHFKLNIFFIESKNRALEVIIVDTPISDVIYLGKLANIVAFYLMLVAKFSIRFRNPFLSANPFVMKLDTDSIEWICRFSTTISIFRQKWRVVRLCVFRANEMQWISTGQQRINHRAYHFAANDNQWFIISRLQNWTINYCVGACGRLETIGEPCR